MEQQNIEKFEQLFRDTHNCKNCDLCKQRKNVVFGEGNIYSKIMFIGEGPGEEEDLEARPFVGKAGKLLDRCLEGLEIDRKNNIYITNVVKCRPPKNRVPTIEEERTMWKNFSRTNKINKSTNYCFAWLHSFKNFILESKFVNNKRKRKMDKIW